ncbi:MAG: AraC family ligand binding domain-containing protein [Spirochaetales bacterium]|nr:AraC family ligand binding domain-containing protein [Spirochaetales bacterium]
MKATETVRVYRCGAGEGATLKRGHGSQPERIHAHVEHSIAFVHRGATRATVGSTSIDLGEGQFIVIPPGVPHLCAPEHPAGFLYSVVYGTSAISAWRPAHRRPRLQPNSTACASLRGAGTTRRS